MGPLQPGSNLTAHLPASGQAKGSYGLRTVFFTARLTQWMLVVQLEAMGALQPGSNLTAHLPTSGQAEGGPGAVAASFAAGVLAYLPQLLVWTLPSTSSYARMQPHTWSGAFQCAHCP